MIRAVGKQLRMILGKALRESGQALDRVGSRQTLDVAYLERYSRHRKLMPIDELWPSHGKSFIAPNASLNGEVMIGNNCAVWYGCVIRGDISAVRIDDNVSIGENSVLYTIMTLPRGIPNSITIANNVLIEQHCTLYSCIIDKGVRVGPGSHVQQGAKLETYSILLPGSVVSPGATVPAYTVYGGSPAKFIRDVTEKDLAETENLLKQQIEQAIRNHEILAALGH